MSATSSDDLMVLHAVRVLGHAPAGRVAARAGLPAEQVTELLLDAQAAGLVAWTRFADDGGWSVTEAGKTHGERLLAAELDGVGARATVEAVLEEFGPLNHLIGSACTRWQLTEMGLAQPAARLEDVLADLTRAAAGLESIEARLTKRLARFGGYYARFVAALSRAAQETAWVSATDRDSAHRVWFELHEDLLATLGHAR